MNDALLLVRFDFVVGTDRMEGAHGYFVSATHCTKLIQLRFMRYVTATKSSSPQQHLRVYHARELAGHGSQQRIDAKCRRVPC